jgi:hypothetical protein
MAAKKKIPTAAPSQSDPQASLDAAAFLSAAQRVLAVLRDDLLTRADESPGVTEALKAQWEVEKEAQRTGDPWEVWRRRVVVQVAAAWVLSLVFARTLEDRGLLERSRIAGPGATDSQEQFRGIAPYLSDRDYLLTVFSEVSNLPAAKDLFDPAHNPVWKLGPSINGARALLDLFRAPDPEAPAFRFGQADTRFLGDLYQNLDKETQERFALLQTPHFVESYILDRTLERAIARFGLDDTTLIDPTCGSGHFLLGAFERLVDHRLRTEPGLDVRAAARKALDAVYGADINPYAVAIARFRLTLAFLDQAGYARLADAPALPLHIVVADSLLHNPQHAQAKLGEVPGQSMKQWEGAEFALEDEAAARDVLHRRFAAVVGNPPYITVKDAVLREHYRETYATAFRSYSLGVPFTERFFQLARGAGFVGMITANSFMKREFGKKLIEQFLPTVNLDGVVNTSGAYIPGHGTPTVLLFGTNEPKQGEDVLSVLAKRGEPSTPSNADNGLVWRSIVDHGTEVGFENDYVAAVRLPRATLEKHPWNLGGGGAAELKELLEERTPRRLFDVIEEIGVACVLREDDLYMQGAAAGRRGVPAESIQSCIEGLNIRDWTVARGTEVIWPYDGSTLAAALGPRREAVEMNLWPWRTLLARRVAFGRTQIERGLAWFEYSMLFPSRYGAAWLIDFPKVATHNHFVLQRHGPVAIASTHVIKLPESATEEDHLALVAYLNSSVVGFFLRQECHEKQMTGGDGIRHSDKTTVTYEFSAGAVSRIPVPKWSQDVGKSLSCFAQEIASLCSRRALLAHEVACADDSDSLASALADASLTSQQLFRRAVGLQEDLDWLMYSLFGLVDKECLGTVGPLSPGERPFEVSVSGVSRTIDGFEIRRPELLAPHAQLFEARERAIERCVEIRLLEDSRFKRRWIGVQGRFNHAKNDLRGKVRDRLLEVALEKLEAYLQTTVEPVPAKQVPRLTHLPTMGWLNSEGGSDFVTNAVATQSVPYLAAMRLRPSGLEKFAAWERCWELQRAEDQGRSVSIELPPKYEPQDFSGTEVFALRGKLDVPLERFISYPGCESDEDKEPVYGWAGWNHLQQAVALATLYLKRKQGEAWGKDRLVPMLAGLEELLPWIWQWHPDPTPESGGMKPGQYIADFLSAQCQELGVTLDDVRAWRRESKKSGVGGAKKTRTPKKSKASTEEETP